MKQLKYLAVAVLFVMILLPIGSVFAQKSLPQVPITYAGDTNETIARRAGWLASAKKESELDWWGTASPNNARGVINQFNKVYPFIKVNYWGGTGEEIANKIDAGYAAGRLSAVDITMGGEFYDYPRWRKAGITANFTDIIPGINKFDKRAYSRYGDWAVLGFTCLTPQYNTKLVSAAEAPKNWDDLLNPKWKGQIGMTNDVKVWVGLASDRRWGIEKTVGFLQKLMQQQPIWAAGHTAGHSLLIAGEFKVLVEDYNYHVSVSRAKGAPVEWIRVNPVVVAGPAFTVIRNAPHPNAANLFIEWLSSPVGMAEFDKYTYHSFPFPGSGTWLATALEGLDMAVVTEEVGVELLETGHGKRLLEIMTIKTK